MRPTRRLLSVKSRPTLQNVSHVSWEDLARMNSGPGGVNAFVTPLRKPNDENRLKAAIKDNICTADFPTTCSSSMLQRFNPPYDATVVKLLKQAEISIVGKTNCDEFGMGSANVYSHHGPVINPYPFDGTASNEWRNRERRTAGGSSGGSAAAVAMGLCDLALGTDTGGSIRLPAAYCGIVGFKPSYGMLSRWGVVSFADSLDCVGIMAKETSVIADAFRILSKHDPSDPTSVTEELRDQLNQGEISDNYGRGGSLRGLRIGIPQEYFPSDLDPSITSQFTIFLQRLSNLGAELISVSLPSTPYALSAYYVISSAEASSNLARYDGMEYGEYTLPDPSFGGTIGDLYAVNRSKHLGPEVRRRMLLGTYALTAAAFDNYFLQAQRLRLLIRDDFDRVFKSRNILRVNDDKTMDMKDQTQVDYLLHPSAIRTAPRLDQIDTNDSLDSYVQDILTVPASLAGLPAINLPSGVGRDGWPLGVSLVGQWGSDGRLLKVANAIEKAS